MKNRKVPTDTLETPALLLDRKIMHNNVDMMSRFALERGVNLRPHFKTSKMIEVARIQAKSGAVGFTCATIAEAQALLDAGFTDIFWAHAPVSAPKARFVAESNRTARLAVGIDSVELARLLSKAALASSTKVPILLEIDTGMNRTGILPEFAVDLASLIASQPGLDLVGVYTHEGQLAGMRVDRSEIKLAGRSAAETLVEVAEELRRRGHNIYTVSVGSTPGWDSAPNVVGVTEARAGTYVFFDANQVRLGSASFDSCAIMVLATVVSAPVQERRVIDAGIKAMSSDRSNRGDTYGIVVSHDRKPYKDTEFTRGYEEHGVVEGSGVKSLKVGDRVRVVPNHACGTVNMYSRVHLVEGENVLDVWRPVARH